MVVVLYKENNSQFSLEETQRHQLTPGRNDISKRSSQEHVKMILVVECADANPHRYYRGLIISLIEHMQQLEGPVLQGKQHSS